MSFQSTFSFTLSSLPLLHRRVESYLSHRLSSAHRDHLLVLAFFQIRDVLIRSSPSFSRVSSLQVGAIQDIFDVPIQNDHSTVVDFFEDISENPLYLWSRFLPHLPETSCEVDLSLQYEAGVVEVFVGIRSLTSEPSGFVGLPASTASLLLSDALSEHFQVVMACCTSSPEEPFSLTPAGRYALSQ